MDVEGSTATAGSAPARPVAVRRALADTGVVTRFRVMAVLTGVLLAVMAFVAMPMKYLPSIGDDRLLAVVAPVHGFLYVLYVLSALDLGLKRDRILGSRWWPGRTLLIVLAGTVPLASFVAERAVVAREARLRAPTSAGSAPV
jgi:integral membrane protein